MKFTVPVEGDYVIWHAFRSDTGRAVRFQVGVNADSYMMMQTYDQTGLGIKARSKQWLWSRYRFCFGRRNNAVLRLKPGEHTLSITVRSPIHLDRLVITNDLSHVPAGKLCTF